MLVNPRHHYVLSMMSSTDGSELGLIHLHLHSPYYQSPSWLYISNFISFHFIFIFYYMFIFNQHLHKASEMTGTVPSTLAILTYLISSQTLSDNCDDYFLSQMKQLRYSQIGSSTKAVIGAQVVWLQSYSLKSISFHFFFFFFLVMCVFSCSAYVDPTILTRKGILVANC